MPSFRKPLPLVPLRDIIVMPHEVRPLFVGRDRSISALRDAVAHPSTDGKSYVVFGLQKNAKTNEPTADDLLSIGTLTQIIQLLPLPDGTVKVLIEGVSRARVKGFAPNEAHFMADYDIVDESVENGVELEALMRAVLTTLKAYTEVNKRIPLELYQQIALIDDPARMSDTIVEKLPMKAPDKQRFLELESPIARLEKLHEFMQREVEIQKVDKKIRTRVKKQMERTQKEFYLNEQMQAIQQELGQKDDGGKSELQELEDKLKSKKLPDEAMTRMKKELKKLKLMGPMSAEATVVRNYIDWVLSLPWGDFSKDRLDVLEAEKVLDADHYGLEKVKERLIDYLAVQQLAGSVKGPILCFVGPPGVGKTSLGRSIARALERKFVRISLGGVRDEAEIRGHRRTYIGAMPGKIVQSLKKAETSNPVFLLDEIDKMSSDFRGDPSAALLEVLDPEQNATFADHYLDLDFDLSKVMFICTANSMHTIPQPLQDRMEIIRIAGYTEAEKLAIARKYLIPKQKEANGLGDTEVAFTTKAIRTVIRRYTRESGVRNLERELAGVFRKCARRVIADGKKPLRVDSKTVIKMLGATKVPKDVNEISDQVGMVNGLAWTEHGGEVLHTEATTMPGKGKLIVTGVLREVMKESAQAAMSYVRAKGLRFGIDAKVFEQHDVHIHFPGSFPKDGPSAGVTMATALVSALTKIPVRKDVAMTGEITLRGRVTAIGGLKEKCLAAHRLGIKTVLVPRENKKDLKEVPKAIRKALRIVLIDFVDDALREALVLEKPEAFFSADATATQPPAVG